MLLPFISRRHLAAFLVRPTSCKELSACGLCLIGDPHTHVTIPQRVYKLVQLHYLSLFFMPENPCSAFFSIIFSSFEASTERVKSTLHDIKPSRVRNTPYGGLYSRVGHGWISRFLFSFWEEERFLMRHVSTNSAHRIGCANGDSLMSVIQKRLVDLIGSWGVYFLPWAEILSAYGIPSQDMGK